MCKEALIHGQEALGLDGLVQTVEKTAVKVSGLIVHPGHYRVFSQLVNYDARRDRKGGMYLEDA